MPALKKKTESKGVELLTKTFAQELKVQGCCQQDFIKAASIILEQAIAQSKESNSNFLQVVPQT